jgi:hypothetical protein
MILLLCTVLLTQASDDAEKRVQEVNELEGEVKMAEALLPSLLQQMKGIVAKGAPPEEAVVQLEASVQASLKTEEREEKRQELTAALAILRSDSYRQAIIRSSTPITPKIPDWAYRALDGSTQAQRGGEVSGAQGLQVVFDGARRQASASLRPQGPEYFQGTPRSPWRISREMEIKINGAIGGGPTVPPAQIDGARRLGQQAAGQREKLGQLEIEVGRADLEIRTQEAAAREIDAQIETLVAPIRPQIAERDKTSQEFYSIASQVTQQRGVVDSNRKRWNELKAQAEKIDKEMLSDMMGFYNRNSSQCRIIREWVEGNTRMFEYQYIPGMKLVEEANACTARANAADGEARRLQAKMEALRPTLEKQNAAIQEPELKIKALRAKRSEAQRSIDQLKAQKTEKAGQMESLRKSLAAAAAEIAVIAQRLRARLDLLTSWAVAAQQAISSLQK